MVNTTSITYPRGRSCRECGSQLEVEVLTVPIMNGPPSVTETFVSCPNNHADPEGTDDDGSSKRIAEGDQFGFDGKKLPGRDAPKGGWFGGA